MQRKKMGESNLFTNIRDFYGTLYGGIGSGIQQAGQALQDAGALTPNAGGTLGARREAPDIDTSVPTGVTATTVPNPNTSFRKGQRELDRQYAPKTGGDAPAPDGSAGQGVNTGMGNPAAKPISNMTYQRFMEGDGGDDKGIGNRLGVNVRNPFVSENLPGTAGYGTSFSLRGSEAAGFEEDYGRTKADTKAILSGSGVETVIDGRQATKVTLNAAKDGVIADQLEAQRQFTPGFGDGTMDDERFGNFGADYEAGTQASPISADRMRARAAFLDGDTDSMTALRRAEGEMGLIKQGGRSFARNPDAEGGLQEISGDAYRSRMSGAAISDAIDNNPFEQASEIVGGAKNKANARLQEFNKFEGMPDTGAQANMAYADPSVQQNPIVQGEDGGFQVIDNMGAINKAKAQNLLSDRMSNIKGLL